MSMTFLKVLFCNINLIGFMNVKFLTLKSMFMTLNLTLALLVLILQFPNYSPDLTSFYSITFLRLIYAKKKTPLGVLIGSELRFDEYISVTCTKVSWKLNALSRITNLMPYEKRRLIMKAFIKSPFNYCTLIRMFHS